MSPRFSTRARRITSSTCRVSFLALAVGVLLQRTNFTLERGRTYGIVGQNGTGKTTLLNRVAAKDIAGFPEDVSVYYIQLQITSEKEETIVDFMVQMVPEGVSRGTVVNTLKEVGFDDEKMAATIQSLSGGWRMKLAIARAMLWNADVLLLDEPTNHLDTSAIAWLSNYLKSLTNTTICLVSHDYDFLADVLTDVIHLSEKTLTYYPMGFRDFQSLKPKSSPLCPPTTTPSPSKPTSRITAPLPPRRRRRRVVDSLSIKSAKTSRRTSSRFASRNRVTWRASSRAPRLSCT